MNYDDRIIALHAQIQEKKDALLEPVVKWKTNKIIILFGKTYNINVLPVDSLRYLGSVVKALVAGSVSMDMDIIELGLKFDDRIITDDNGNALRDILSDILSQLKILYYRQEMAKLNNAEKQVIGKLSEDAKTEQLFNEIELMLGD